MNYPLSLKTCFVALSDGALSGAREQKCVGMQSLGELKLPYRN